MAQQCASCLQQELLVDEKRRCSWLEMGHKRRVAGHDSVDSMDGISLRCRHRKRYLLSHENYDPV